MCFVALVIQNANGIRLVILSSVASLAVQYFSTLSHKQEDSGHEVSVLIFSTALKHFLF